ncbi:pyridoxal phosphate-dependent transferase [Syncephalis fuscata]|nr:pyridoxal phosphate-dependent transferase [Syncephalis fuscata]
MFKLIINRSTPRFISCSIKRPLTTIDLRSDTVTTPTPAMLMAAQECAVGDDVYEEDPTVIALEQRIADMTGHEAAYSVLAQPPHSVLCDQRAHVHQYECGGLAFHSQANTIAVTPRNNMHLTVDDIEACVVMEDIHNAPTRVISLENTLDGTVNGARLWNASVATGISMKQYGSLFDSVSSKPFIKKARWFRKLFGGGWRQAGILASMGLVALEDYPQRMAQDHLHATQLAKAWKDQGFVCQLPVQTNMVFINTGTCSATQIATHLQQCNIRVMPFSESIIRMVVHHQITSTDIERLTSTLPRVLHASLEPSFETEATSTSTTTTTYYKK